MSYNIITILLWVYLVRSIRHNNVDGLRQSMSYEQDGMIKDKVSFKHQWDMDFRSCCC